MNIDIERGAPWFNRGGECDEALRHDRDQAMGMDTDTKRAVGGCSPTWRGRRGVGDTLVPDVTDSARQRPELNAQRLTAEYPRTGRRGSGGTGHGPDLLLPTVGRVAVVLLVWVLAVHLAHAATGWGTAQWWYAGLCLEQCKAT